MTSTSIPERKPDKEIRVGDFVTIFGGTPGQQCEVVGIEQNSRRRIYRVEIPTPTPHVMQFAKSVLTKVIPK